ncbi:nucleic acid/nucleotide deaminase domain-containing protein [Streptomyces cyaneofuscatus]|uniref:nucleic acid/nucleotide deaminase domain-containing protein n=1 Tax=Streptomyces cyaneofuscatus TaxID=66883 RepID=UPI00381C9986
MTLPDDLVGVLDLIGVDWPQIDEDEVKSSATDYRNLAEGIRDAVKEGNNACAHIVGGKSRGETVKSIDRRWGKLTTRDLATFAKGCDDLADALDECADLVLTCKIAIVTKLSATAATATAGAVGMFFTAGISGLLSAAAIAAARFIIAEAIDYAVEQITSVVTDKIEGKVLAEIEKLFTDRMGGGGTYDVMAAGSSDMAMDLAIEFDEFDKASGGYQKTANNFNEKKGSFKESGGKRKTAVKKDSRFHKLSTVMDKAEDSVEKKTDEMVKTLEEHGGKIDESKREHRRTDEDRKRDFDKCKVDDSDEVRTYILNSDGTVDKLLPSGVIDEGGLDHKDKLNLANISTDGKVWRPVEDADKRKWNTPGEHAGTVASRKIDPGGSDLAQATQLARKAHDYYGGKNYAAGRYIDPENGRESILVGRSEGGFHSEKVIGHPLLHTGNAAGLKEMFTEREPCQKNPQCNRWLDYYFKSANPDLRVTHAADYDQFSPGQGKEHQQYMRDLKREHGKV